MGAEVPEGFMGLGLEGWHTRAWKGGHTSMNINMDVYTAAARVGGRFVVRAVDWVQRVCISVNMCLCVYVRVLYYGCSVKL